MTARPGIPTPPYRYSVAQVLRGIQAFVTEHCGPEVQIDSTASVYAYCAPAADSHECPLVFLTELAEYFGFSCTERRWLVWLELQTNARLPRRERKAAWNRWEGEIAPRLTVAQLAEFIARHAPAQSLAPATVFGNRCASAGVFLGICEMPEARGRRLATSTPLRTLRSSQKIRQLWRRAEWVSGVILPPVDEPSPRRLTKWSDWAMAAVGVLALACGVGVGATLWPTCGGAALLPCLIAAAAPMLAGAAVVDRCHNPLPPDVVSFGDMARLIASRRTASDSGCCR